MITKINVVLVNETEHVLAAVVRTAEAPGTSELEIDDLAKPSLLVRGRMDDKPTEELVFHIFPEELAAKTADVNDDVRAVQGNPRGFRFDSELKKLSSAKLGSTSKLTHSDVEVRLTAPVTEDTPVWIQIEGGTIPEGDPLNLTGSILPTSGPPPGQAVDIPISPPLAAGSYRALVLVKDRPLFFKTAVIP